jgi:hypothetical protein
MKPLLAVSLLLAGLSQFTLAGTASAQTGACPGGYVSKPEDVDRAHPAYYFPARPATMNQPEFPAALTVFRTPCPYSNHVQLTLRMTVSPGRNMVAPRVDIYQHGIHLGCAGAAHQGDGFTGWPGLCREFSWYPYITVCSAADFCILPEDALKFHSYSRYIYSLGTTTFNPDLPFTLKVRGNEASTIPSQVYEVPGRGMPGNIADIPQSVAGMWWNPAQSGWGLMLHRNERGVMFATWLTYDDSGRSTWFVMLNGQEVEPGVIAGPVQAMRGHPFRRPDLETTIAGETVGQFRFTFKNSDAGEFHYTVNGRSGMSPIERLVIRDDFGRVCKTSDGKVLEVDGIPGWAANLVGGSPNFGRDLTTCGTHATLVTYDDAGKPMWVYGALRPKLPRPEVVLDSNRFMMHPTQGALFRPSGTPYGRPWDPSRFTTGAPIGTWDTDCVIASNGDSCGPPPFTRGIIDIGGVTRVLSFRYFTFEY